MLKKISHVLYWFIGLVILSRLLLGTFSIGYLWLVLLGQASFFSWMTRERELKLDPEVSQQVIRWMTAYREQDYSNKISYLNGVVNKAIKENYQLEAEQLLKLILELEPENEAAKSLLVALWGTDLMSQQLKIS